MKILRALVVLAAVLAGSAAVPPAGAAVRLDPLQNDEGTYNVYCFDRLLGTEKFTLIPAGDSIMTVANVDEVIPTPQGDAQLKKSMGATFMMIDWSMLLYVSDQNMFGHQLKRGISFHDTTVSLFTEADRLGSGDVYARPPGRVFVIDSQLFINFDIMLRSLRGKMTAARDMPVIVLSTPGDTIIDLKFAPGQIETVRVDGRDIRAQRVTFSDSEVTFTAWVDDKGRMARLDQPAVGLRVERLSGTKGLWTAKTREAAAKPAERLPSPKQSK